jgi:hypothetical protein
MNNEDSSGDDIIFRANASEEHPWHGERACLTSKHSKLRVIEPPLREALGLCIFEESSLDTDLLGTFSGEVERPGTAQEVVLRKARWGAEKNNTRFGIATEGSFGPHPHLPFMASHNEWIAWIDRENESSMIESYQTERTNFSHRVVKTYQELEPFLEKLRFPSHALIARPSDIALDSRFVFRGLQDFSALRAAIGICATQSPTQKVYIETDMRAHVNPTRQEGILEVAKKLAVRIQTLCSACGYPGWGIIRLERGLECESCGKPGRWVKAEVIGCARCQHEVKRPRPDGRTLAPSSACESCIAEED